MRVQQGAAGLQPVGPRHRTDLVAQLCEALVLSGLAQAAGVGLPLLRGAFGLDALALDVGECFLQGVAQGQRGGVELGSRAFALQGQALPVDHRHHQIGRKGSERLGQPVAGRGAASAQAGGEGQPGITLGLADPQLGQGCIHAQPGALYIGPLGQYVGRRCQAPAWRGRGR